MISDKIGKTVGILGGGQLGKMMCADAHRLGLKVCVLDPSPDCPCHGLVDKHLIGDFKDPDQVMRFLDEGCEVVTVEIEHVNVDSLDALVRAGVKVQPAPNTIRVIQDKLLQKNHLINNHIAVGPYQKLNSAEDLKKIIKKFGLPVVLKSRKHAYDGRGNTVIRHPTDPLSINFEKLGPSSFYVEKWVNFKKELSVIVARSQEGKTVTFPVIETIHKDNICHTVVAPAPISDSTACAALQLAKDAVASLEGAGIFTVEMFLIENGEVLVNEIAPRPHNSGHFTIEACATSQYEQHLRAILGLPLGDPSMVVPAAVMVNILGTGDSDSDLNHTLAPLNRALTLEGTHIHWYGKSSVKKSRKMGHVTFVGNSMDEVNQRVEAMQVEEIRGGRFTIPCPQVGIIMGSDSDLPKMKAAAEILQKFGISFEVTIVSAHRTPERMFEYAKNAHVRGLRVIIAGAGGAAHLPGMVAALTPLPVIGVPVRTEPLDGTDALLSIVQMPRGVPVATVAINNSTNAGLLAARIVGSLDRKVLKKMMEYQSDMRDGVMEKVEKMGREGWAML